MFERFETGAAETSFMSLGDPLHIEMPDKAGETIFGAIERTLRQKF